MHTSPVLWKIFLTYSKTDYWHEIQSKRSGKCQVFIDNECEEYRNHDANNFQK